MSKPGSNWRRKLGKIGRGLVIILACNLFLSNYTLKTTTYACAVARLAAPVRIVFLSDLHGRAFGWGNWRLVSRVTELEPDAIALVGDIIGSSGPEREIAGCAALIRDLQAIAPVYFTPGNQELSFAARYGSVLTDRIAAAGVRVLDESYEDVTLNGAKIRLGGVYAAIYAREDDWVYWRTRTAYPFMLDFSATDLPTVMLAHRPDSFVFTHGWQGWGLDLILSGHTHGGLIRLPGAGGLYVPNHGWFPAFDYGRVNLGQTTLLVTSGLSGYEYWPRLFSRPEIAVADLLPGGR